MSRLSPYTHAQQHTRTSRTFYTFAVHRPALITLQRRYWDFRDKLSTDDGMLLKGPRLIIPGEVQEEYLSRLHEGHLSASKVQENAKQHMYWTGIDADMPGMYQKVSSGQGAPPAS